jgi:excisionase family DNA binding protein
MEDDWLPLAEAAARFGVAPQTVRRWVREGRLPAERCQGPNAGRAWVRLADLRRAASARGAGGQQPMRGRREGTIAA